MKIMYKDRMNLELGKRVMLLQEARNLDRRKLAEQVNISYEALSNIENGKVKPHRRTLIKLADALKTTVEYLEGKTNNPAPPQALEGLKDVPGFVAEAREYFGQTKYLPIYGSIPAGKSFEIQQCKEGDFSVPSNMYRPNRFILRVSGDSMSPMLIAGDQLLMEFVENNHDPSFNNKICAILLNNESVLKRVMLKKDLVELKSDNPNYPTIKVTKKDDFKIQAVMIEIVKGVR